MMDETRKRPEDEEKTRGVTSEPTEGIQSSIKRVQPLPEESDNSSNSARKTRRRFRKKGSPSSDVKGQGKNSSDVKKRKKSLGQQCRSFLSRLFRAPARTPRSQSLSLSPPDSDPNSTNPAKEKEAIVSQSVKVKYKPRIDVALTSPNNSFQVKSRRSPDGTRPHSNSFSNRSQTSSVKSGSSPTPKAIINISPSLKVVAITPTEDGSRPLTTDRHVSNDCVVLSFTQTEVRAQAPDSKSVQANISGGEALKVTSSYERRGGPPPGVNKLKSPGYSVTVRPNNDSPYAFDYKTSDSTAGKSVMGGNSSQLKDNKSRSSSAGGNDETFTVAKVVSSNLVESKEVLGIQSNSNSATFNVSQSETVNPLPTVQSMPSTNSEQHMMESKFPSSERDCFSQPPRTRASSNHGATAYNMTLNDKHEESQEALDIMLDNAMKEFACESSSMTFHPEPCRLPRDQSYFTRSEAGIEPVKHPRHNKKTSQDANNNVHQRGYTFGEAGNHNTSVAFFSKDPLILYSRGGVKLTAGSDAALSPDSGVSSAASPFSESFKNVSSSQAPQATSRTTLEFPRESSTSLDFGRQHKYPDGKSPFSSPLASQQVPVNQPDRKLVNVVSPTPFSEFNTAPRHRDGNDSMKTSHEFSCENANTLPVQLKMFSNHRTIDEGPPKPSIPSFPGVPPPSYNSIIVEGDPVDLSRFKGHRTESIHIRDGMPTSKSENLYDLIPVPAPVSGVPAREEGIYEQIPFHGGESPAVVGRMFVEPKLEHVEFSLKPIHPSVSRANQTNLVQKQPVRESSGFCFPTIVRPPIKDFRINEAVQQELRDRLKNLGTVDERYNILKEEYLGRGSPSQTSYKPHCPQTFAPVQVVQDSHDKNYFSEDEIRQKKRQLDKLVEMERQKRALRERLELQSRRHTDRYGDTVGSPMTTKLTRNNLLYDNIEPPRSSKITKYRGRARALYNFKAQKPRELSLRKGDVVYLLRKIDRNWFEGEHHGMVGIFPITYVEVLESIEEVQSIARLREGSATVLHDFCPRSPFELPLKKGYVVTLIKRLDRNWYEGRCGNKQGIFPVSYVSTIREPDTPIGTPCATPAPTPSQSRIHTPLPGGQPGWQSPSASSIFSYDPDVPAAPRSPTMFSVDFSRESTPFGGSVVGAPTSFPHRPSSVMSEPVRTREFRTLPLVAPRPMQQGLSPMFAGSRHPLRTLNARENVYDNTDFGDCFSDCGWTEKPEVAIEGRRDRGVAQYRHFQTPATFGTLDASRQTNDELRTVRKKPTKLSFAPIPEKDADNEAIKPIIYPRYRALHNFQPRSAEELGLDKEDVVRVVEKCKDGWYIGFLESTRQFGLFPGNFVEPLRL